MAKVLIIESDAAVARALSDNLSRADFESQVTADGTEGLTIARSWRPDVIVLCVELSRVSGYSICNKLKKDPELGQIPLILTSSQATEETFEQHKKLKTRAEAYVKKPYSDAEIMGLIRQHAGGGDDLEVSIDDVSVEVEEEGDDVSLDYGVVGGSSSDPFAESDLGEKETAPKPAERRAPERLAVEPTVASPKAPASRAGAVSDASLEQVRAENQKLRQKVQALERSLEEKDLEFNDRLLQESTRSREAVDIKKKAAVLERDLQKQKELADKNKLEGTEARQELERLKQGSKATESEKQVLSDKIGQLVDKLKALAAERDNLQHEVARLTQARDAQQREVENVTKMHEKAKKAVDIAMQLLDETGLVQ